MIEGKIKEDEDKEVAASATDNLSKQIMKLNVFDDVDDESDKSDDDNNDDGDVVRPTADGDDDDDDEIIQGLSNFSLDPEADRQNEEEYTSKGPVFRRQEVSHRAAPYQPDHQPKPQQQQQPLQLPLLQQQQPGDEQTVEEFLEQFDVNLLEEAKLLEADFEELDSKKDIPLLPDCNVTSATSKLIVQNMDPFFNTKETLSQPRLILKQMGGGFIVLPNSVFVSADTSARKLGVVLPRVPLPDNAIRSVDSVEVLFQPNPRDQRTVQAVAKIAEAKDSQGQTCGVVIPEQFVELSPFVLKGASAVDVLLQDVTKEDIDAAVALVNRQDSQDIFKTYGPNNDSMLMTLCCKKDDTPTIRAQVFALSARILSEKDTSLRQNLVMKNASGLSALDYTTVTNNARIAVYLAEIFYNLGQDIFCRDTSGNTILHVMARKGDSVAPTLETLLALRFRHGNGGKVYTCNVSNGKEFLPLHIAAMSSKCPHNTIRILRNNFEQSFLARTQDGSLPLHLACQYSMDPNLLASLLYFGKASVVNERRTDGFTPLHLVAARNEARDVKLGLIPLDEMTQVRMIKLLLDHGADKNLTVEDYRPVDLIKPDRAHALQQFRLNSLARKQDRMMYAGGVSPPYMCDSPSQLSCGDRSPVMSQPSPTGPNDPFLGNGMYSDSEASPNPHQMNSWQQSPYAYHYSPSGHNGSVSSGVDNFSGASDESDEDNNSGELDAIAQVLITHPSIQAAIEAATRIN